MIGVFTSIAGIPGAQNSKAAWRQRLGERFEDIEPLLKPAGKLATNVPCEHTTSHGCSFRIVHHSPTDIVGVCDRGHCETHPFLRGEIMVMRLDTADVGRKISEAFGFRASLVKSSLPEFQSVGDYEPTVGYRFPIFLAAGFQDRHRTEVQRIIAGCRKPPAAIWFSSEGVDSATAYAIEAEGGMNLLLDDIVTLARGVINPVGAAGDVFGELDDTNIEDAGATATLKKYHLPAGSTWEDITIKFQGEDSVTIKCGKKPTPVVYTFSDFGLCSKRATSPKRAWTVLKAFADGEGDLIPPDARDSKSKGHKQKELLSKALREVFSLDEEPLPWNDEIYGWRARFNIFPVGGVK